MANNDSFYDTPNGSQINDDVMPTVDNSTHSEHDIGLTPEKILVPILFSVIVLIGFFGNVVVITVVIRNREHFKNTTNLFILNLSVADLLYLLFCVPFHTVIYVTGNWPFGNVMCKIDHLVQYSSMIGSILTLVAMAADRYLAVAYGIETKHLRTPRVAFIACVIIWIVALAFAVPMPFVYSVKYYPPYPGYVCADQWRSREYRKYYHLVLTIVCYVIPLTVIFVLSVLLVRCLWLSKQPEGPRHNPKSIMRKRKVTRLIFFIVLAFFICWLPSHMVWIWVNFFPDQWPNTYAHYSFRVFAHALSYANSAINPVLYTFLSINFRRGFRKAILCQTVQQHDQRYTFTRIGSRLTNGATCRRTRDIVRNGNGRAHQDASNSSDAFNLFLFKGNGDSIEEKSVSAYHDYDIKRT